MVEAMGTTAAYYTPGTFQGQAILCVSLLPPMYPLPMLERDPSEKEKPPVPQVTRELLQTLKYDNGFRIGGRDNRQEPRPRCPFEAICEQGRPDNYN